VILPVVAFPVIDPIIFEITLGPLSFALRWYALAYIAGIVGGWWLARPLVELSPRAASREQLADAVTWITLGIILGGRLGYVLFYRPGYYVTVPWEALFVWQGGMSFHGGMLGVAIAMLWFCRRERLDPLLLTDRVATVVPIGLFLGRLANFINGELWGRVSDVPWAMVFPYGGPEPRHPSQLYQAFLEGICLFALLQALVRVPSVRARPGMLCGVFLAGYGVARVIGEVFRQPDENLGFLFGGVTMGQLLSLPMVAVGAWLIVRARNRPALA
jgi:phosphatidylglycerol:prolipoprotein diacylglycerol transferase